jgi:hypothetical protein
MPGVAVDEAVTADNPLLFFTFQKSGRLVDIDSLKRSVYDVSGPSEAVRIAEAALNIAAVPTGVKLQTGVYHANFTAASGIGGFVAGTHEVRWKYKETATSPEIEVRQRFEVLDKAKFFSGRIYVGYADSKQLKAVLEFSTTSIGDLQELIDSSSRDVERLTARFFEPRRLALQLDGKNSRGMLLSHPIIGVQKVEIESGITGLSATLTEINLDGLRLYARHLAGLLDPDDRDDPRIEIERFEGQLFQSLDFFPRGPQVVHVTGVFGYTDPDGGPFGITPKNLARVVGALALDKKTNFIGSTPDVTTMAGVKSAKTRDQSITFQSGSVSRGGGGRTGSAAYGGLTGDDFIDMILIPYVRPAHMAAV